VERHPAAELPALPASPQVKTFFDRTASGSSSLLPDSAHHAGIGIMTRSDIILVELMAKG
jgi:hypothetical protein